VKACIKNLLLLPALIAALGMMLSGEVKAQTFTTLYNDNTGNSVGGELILSGNSLFGTGSGVHGKGSVSAINVNGTGFTNLYSFTALVNGTNGDGANPDGGLILSGNTLYGTASEGGTNGNGTIFAINTNGTGFTNLYSFPGVNGGYSPNDDLVLSGNTLYGTTEFGGSSGIGTLFAINTDGTGFTYLHFFTGGSGGTYPNGGLVLSGNILYGTAWTGGSSQDGIVFSINTNGTGFTNLYSFTGGSGGINPNGGLVLSGNKLYGTCHQGGSGPLGIVFSINTNGTGFTNLYSFTNGTDGALPDCGLIISGNTLYGTASGGVTDGATGISGNGAVFAVNADGTDFTNLHTFTTGLGNYPHITNSDGAAPTSKLILSGNILYGTAPTGGTNGYGTLFSIPLGSVSAPLQITTTSLPGGTNGVAYIQTLAATGGQTPYSWTNIVGGLPAGLSLSSSGVISGTTAISGTTNFTVKVTDANSNTATQGLTLTMVTVVGPPSVAIQPTNNPVLVVTGSNVTFSVSVTGVGTFSYQWQLNGTNLPNGIITTVAGNGTYGYSGDGSAATNAELEWPSGVAVDPTGNLFIADWRNQRIRKVGVNGIITTVAGNGTASYSGDGGAATNAELNYPIGVAVDSTGNLFIADEDNQRIRKVGINGIITTVAGNGTASYSGDGGAATNAELNYPIGVAVDSTGNQFISDSNHRIRKVGTNGIIYTVAGNGTANYSGDVGAATNAELNNPFGVTVDATGNLFIADSGNQRIRMVGTNEIITTVAGNGTASYSGDGGAATNAELFYPYGVTVDATGNLLIADSSNNRIRKVGTNEIITTVAGNGTASYSGDGGAATNAELYLPYGVAVDASGNLFIADERNNRIRKEFMQGPTLVLNNVGIGNAGAYDVVVSNPYGSVTSSVVNLTITVPVPVFQPPIFNNGQFMLAWSAVSNGVYQLQYKTNLLQTNWVNVGSTITASNTVLSATNAIGADQQRFYRVQQQ